MRSPLPLGRGRSFDVALLLTALLASPACSKAERAPSAAPRMESAPAASGGSTARSDVAAQQAALPGAPQKTLDVRRIIRTAELSLETDHADEAQKKITSLAEAKGGFVVSADTSRYRSESGAETTTVHIVLRVPTPAFESTLDALRAIGTRVAREKVTGQDVTEEYLDLEARLRAQRAVEEQYLTILKQAKTISDTLMVQQKLGEVRSEIERAEGRRRFLESQTSLSTITVYLARTIDAVDASGPGFGRSVKRAFRDAIEVGVGIINFLIRSLGVLIPVFFLLLLPIYLVVRIIRRRRQRPGK